MIDKELKRIGDMLNQFYNLELFLNSLITKYFKPEKETKFFKIMLNTSVTPYGAKVKILPNLVEIDRKIINHLHELGRIRNGVAHVAPHLVLDLKDGKGKMSDSKSNVAIMQSNGKIVNKDFWKLSERFNELLDIVVPVIRGHIKSLE